MLDQTNVVSDAVPSPSFIGTGTGTGSGSGSGSGSGTSHSRSAQPDETSRLLHPFSFLNSSGVQNGHINGATAAGGGAVAASASAFQGVATSGSGDLHVNPVPMTGMTGVSMGLGMGLGMDDFTSRLSDTLSLSIHEDATAGGTVTTGAGAPFIPIPFYPAVDQSQPQIPSPSQSHTHSVALSTSLTDPMYLKLHSPLYEGFDGLAIREQR